MKSVFKVLSLTVGCLLLSSMAFGQWTLFTVEEGAAPGGTTYPTLTEALATAATFPNGPHKIMILAGDYYDVNLTVSNVDEIYGDPAAAKEDIVFHGASHFMNLTSGLKITNMTITGYDNALRGNGVNSCMIENVVFDDNNYGVVLFGGAFLNTVQKCLFVNNNNYGVWCDATTGGGGFNTIKDNCFIDNNGGGVQGYDATAVNWWSHDYWSDDAGTNYALDGAGPNFDYNPWRRENQVTGDATVDVLGDYHVDLNWVAPTCSAGDPVQLAAHEFTVTYDPNFLKYVGADYGEAPDGSDLYMGTTAKGALYTQPAVDEVGGTITFAATNFDLPGVGDGRLGFINFTAKATTASTVITVGSDYRDELNNPIPAGSKSLTLAVVDDVLPAGTVVFDDPIDNMTFSNSYSMKFSGDATDNYCLSQVYYQVPGYIGWTLIKSLSGQADSYGPVTVSMATIPEGGPYTLQVLFRDCSSNDFIVNNEFDVDKTGPDVANLVLADLDGCGATAGYTNAPAITVSWDNPDASAVQYEFYYNKDAGWGKYGPYTGVSPTTFTLNDVEATDHQLWVRQYDVYGNMGPQTGYTQIALDKTPGSPSGLTLDGGAAKTPDRTVAVSATAWSVASGSIKYFLTETKSQIACGATGWLPIVPPYVYDFELSDVDGVHWVFRATMDIAGNVSAIDSASIELDRVGPALTSFNIHSLTGAECSNTLSPAYMAVYTFGATDAVTLQYSFDDATWGLWKDMTGVPSADSVQGGFTNPGDGMKTVYARLIDNVGNPGASKNASLYVKLTPPVLGTVVCADKNGNGLNANWSDDLQVNVTITGGDMDEARLAETLAGLPAATYKDYANPTTYLLTRGDVTAEGQQKRVFAEGRDCAWSTVTGQSNYVRFDLVFPVWNSININGGAVSTNSRNVTVNVNITEGFQWKLWLSEDNTFATKTEYITSVTVGGFAYTLTGLGDGIKTVYARVFDNAGNFANEDCSIDLDETKPTAGTFVMTSPNPLAVGGYTSTLLGNTYVFTPADDDLIDIAIDCGIGGAPQWLGWYAPAPLPLTGTLPAITGVVGPVTVQYYLLDDAGNYNGPFTSTPIMYNNVNPPAPTGAQGVPGGSLMLTWAAAVDDQAYQIRYNFTNEHPVYASGPPPFPATMGQGILAVAKHPTNSFLFEGPQDDLYAFGIWTLNKYGLWSLNPNATILENNYRLGDYQNTDEVLGSDGCLSFDPEFTAMAVAYNTLIGGTYYNEYLDFGPTIDGSPVSNADPDGAVNFEDLVLFALNYKWSRAQSECDGQKAGGSAAAALADLTVSAQLPNYARIGDEFTVPISISEGSGVAGYHLVFDYDKSALDVVSVKAGQVYDGIARSFFYYDANAAGIDISSAVLNDEGFLGGEIAVVTFKSKTSGGVTLKDHLLDVRDWNNHKPQVNFSLTASGGSLPTAYSLSQNYPNPFNPTTTIELALPVAGQYRLTVYNVIGQEVKVMEGYAEAGYVTLNWDASKQSSGVYLYKVTAGDFSATRKMILLK